MTAQAYTEKKLAPIDYPTKERRSALNNNCSTFPHLNEEAKSLNEVRSFISYQKGATSKKDGLTTDQQKAFREVFDLFDSNGGGTIDANELDEALKSAEIYLTKEEIADVLTSMDKDGNGEIDFEEFLILMTNTERFLESVMVRTDQQKRQREVLLFDALTEFMKKSALHSINEIVGYYHSKYKRVQQPHVIRHYAAGARLIGLSEQQIRRHLDRLRESSVDSKSPYAQPLYAFFYNTKTIKPTVTMERRNELLPSKKLSTVTENVKIIVSEDKLTKPRGKIRLKFVLGECIDAEKEDKKVDTFDVLPVQQEIIHLPKRFSTPKKQYNGWRAPRINASSVPLPSLTSDLLKKQVLKEKKLIGDIAKKREMKRDLTFDDMAVIRKRVGSLTKLYYKRIQCEKCDTAERHWKKITAEDIPSKRTLDAFSHVFQSYVDYRNMPVSSLCSRSLA